MLTTRLFEIGVMRKGHDAASGLYILKLAGVEGWLRKSCNLGSRKEGKKRRRRERETYGEGEEGKGGSGREVKAHTTAPRLEIGRKEGDGAKKHTLRA